MNTKFVSLTALLLLFNFSGLNFWQPSGTGEDGAYAKSSGGRTRGGSFRSSPSRSNSSTTSPSRPSNTYQSNPVQPSQPNNTTIVPIFIPGANNNYNNNPNPNYSNNYRSSSSSSSGDWIIGLMVILGIAGVGFFIYWMIRKSSQAGGLSELDNDTVTVTKLQVALLAEARTIQSELNDIALTADTDTIEGLTTLLQEAAIALLRTPENWSHVVSSSQSVKRDGAEEVFNSISIAERTKFSAETLVNVNGSVRKSQTFKLDPESDPAAYIVITLLIGTEHDQPLFAEVKSRESLQLALEKIAAIPSSHLVVFELLWSPQAEGDSVSYDELLTEYTNMVQI
jgi:uncharacterized membrane protein